MAERGAKTLAYGPMKPVGLTDPRTGRWPHAVVQLRQEDKRGVLYSLVGFQTKLRIGAQRRLFRTLPGAEEAVFARFGSVHRNTYLNAPRHLTESLELRARPGVYVAGQLAGVEGYVESAALGGLAGIQVAFDALGREAPRPDPATAHGALLAHLAAAPHGRFQPMNVNFGLFPPLGPGGRRGRRERYAMLSERALAAIADFAGRAAIGDA
jgi:methylenetetrahydrofolate--tRNA-(uracil-5-)-methyltransferase